MTKFIRAGMALFNAERVICIEQRENRVVFVFDTGQMEFKLDNEECAQKMFELVAKQTDYEND